MSAPPAPLLERPTARYAENLRRASPALASGRPRALAWLTVGALLGAAHGQVTTAPGPGATGAAFDPDSEANLTTIALITVGGLAAVGFLGALIVCLWRRVDRPAQPREAPPPTPRPPPPRPPPPPLRRPIEVVVVQPDQTPAIARPLGAPNLDDVPSSPPGGRMAV